MAGFLKFNSMITIEDIQKDIQIFQERIEKAKDQLAGLPVGFLPYQEHKKREKIRREAEAEIKHCQGLITYALKGIELRQGRKSN